MDYEAEVFDEAMIEVGKTQEGLGLFYNCGSGPVMNGVNLPLFHPDTVFADMITKEFY